MVAQKDVVTGKQGKAQIAWLGEKKKTRHDSLPLLKLRFAGYSGKVCSATYTEGPSLSLHDGTEEKKSKK